MSLQAKAGKGSRPVLTYHQLSDEIFALEGVRVVFHTPHACIPGRATNYPFVRPLGPSPVWSFDYLYDRIWRTLGRPATHPEMSVVDGHGNVHPLRHSLPIAQNHPMYKIRKTYRPQ